MTRAQRKEMAAMLRMFFDKIEAERVHLLVHSAGPGEQHVMMAGFLMAEASSKLKQAAFYLDEPAPTHERKRK
jgi:hypothetical protein